ncbi:MAG: S23 ribosomal protein [Candidatus Peregrinibacteria bacterium Gr01-1014_25]|nr:MAG: S23 ribosomal protein [Candidatus Peregrinibacteria bacterium Gr01-1014_25]
MIEGFTKFEAWGKAMDIASALHELTGHFPAEERFALVSQMRRASVSVAANIAEGFGRYTAADKKHKYVQARGELVEVMTFLHYCKRVGYSSPDRVSLVLADCDEMYKLLNALIATMHRRNPNP